MPRAPKQWGLIPTAFFFSAQANQSVSVFTLTNLDSVVI
jgi:hypothetical protein